MKNQISSCVAENATNLKGKWTPGPWMVDFESDYEFPNDCIDIMDNEGDGYIAKVYAHTSAETQKANARLIATAPELLEACKAAITAARMDRWENAGSVRHGAFEALRAAIAEAEGVTT